MEMRAWGLVVAGAVFVLVGCNGGGTTSEVVIDPSTGNVRERRDIRSGKVVSEIRRILETRPVQGEGTFKVKNKTAAIQGARALALKDLAEKVGDVLVDARITAISTEDKDRIVSTVRIESRNIISGWDYFVPPTWDPATGEAKVIVIMNVAETAKTIVRKAGVGEDLRKRGW